MKVKEYKNKIVLAELNPDADYIMLLDANTMGDFDPRYLNFNGFRNPPKVMCIWVQDIDKSIRFVEVPQKKSII